MKQNSIRLFKQDIELLTLLSNLSFFSINDIQSLSYSIRNDNTKISRVTIDKYLALNLFSTFLQTERNRLFKVNLTGIFDYFQAPVEKLLKLISAQDNIQDNSQQDLFKFVTGLPYLTLDKKLTKSFATKQNDETKLLDESYLSKLTKKSKSKIQNKLVVDVTKHSKDIKDLLIIWIKKLISELRENNQYDYDLGLLLNITYDFKSDLDIDFKKRVPDAIINFNGRSKYLENIGVEHTQLAKELMSNSQIDLLGEINDKSIDNDLDNNSSNSSNVSEQSNDDILILVGDAHGKSKNNDVTANDDLLGNLFLDDDKTNHKDKTDNADNDENGLIFL
jgi:hypothetical protein